VHRKHTKAGRKSERGVIILLVAIVLLFVVGAMAVLAIDLVTFYTARSEAQLAADGAALAGARVLANSGMTSNPSDVDLVAAAKSLAITIAQQVAQQNKVGGRNLNPGEINPSFPNAGQPGFGSNPQMKVQVTRDDLPTFFARIWGRTQVTVTASATAEAYNPSGGGGGEAENRPPVAPLCVKPWLLPNIDPTNADQPIFNRENGTIQNPSLLTYSFVGGSDLKAACGSGAGCALPQAATAGSYYPGSQTSFPVPTQGQPACSGGFSDYQLSIAGCVQQPILCGANSNVNLAVGFSESPPNKVASDAVNCLTHAQGGLLPDSVDSTVIPSPPFQFLAGTGNPVAGAIGTDVMVSDSLVTIPVVDVSPGQNFTTPPNVKVVGFLQAFLNPTGVAAPASGVPAMIVNMAGCGTQATGQPILGNGASTIPVRLISPSTPGN
jgi:Flp pilus assembly protein TadG